MDEMNNVLDIFDSYKLDKYLQYVKFLGQGYSQDKNINKSGEKNDSISNKKEETLKQSTNLQLKYSQFKLGLDEVDCLASQIWVFANFSEENIFLNSIDYLDMDISLHQDQNSIIKMTC
ncbi:hypothetical protein PPERSA_01223 [Pseudocohnilembus persalinus]|uniref:Uncharacterized protein n=1 Tax=Pseudocohnilembus persalinus TaxID=266149 RepID=A0A0V0R9I0_PSEPJ|nr:hypothetical protein PPERSA_01223 [Pseudocohnilembus persalinus]|eukprot:KRX11024.1 hypothetical protein PPERSA_01223 [Pseudocohnilembus persalinus]